MQSSWSIVLSWYFLKSYSVVSAVDAELMHHLLPNSRNKKNDVKPCRPSYVPFRPS